MNATICQDVPFMKENEQCLLLKQKLLVQPCEQSAIKLSAALCNYFLKILTLYSA